MRQKSGYGTSQVVSLSGSNRAIRLSERSKTVSLSLAGLLDVYTVRRHPFYLAVL